MLKRLILIIILLATACTSCITMTLATVAATTAYALGAGTTRLKGNTITRIDDKAAVMRTNKGELVCIVYPFKGYHDGMKVNAKFRRGGEYEYYHESGNRLLIPIYLESKHIGDLIETAIAIDVHYRQHDEAPVYQV